MNPISSRLSQALELLRRPQPQTDEPAHFQLDDAQGSVFFQARQLPDTGQQELLVVRVESSDRPAEQIRAAMTLADFRRHPNGPLQVGAMEQQLSFALSLPLHAVDEFQLQGLLVQLTEAHAQVKY